MLPINTGTTTDIHETSVYTVSQKVTTLHFLLTISEVNDQTSRLVLQLDPRHALFLMPWENLHWFCILIHLKNSKYQKTKITQLLFVSIVMKLV